MLSPEILVTDISNQIVTFIKHVQKCEHFGNKFVDDVITSHHNTEC